MDSDSEGVEVDVTRVSDTPIKWVATSTNRVKRCRSTPVKSKAPSSRKPIPKWTPRKTFHTAKKTPKTAKKTFKGSPLHPTQTKRIFSTPSGSRSTRLRRKSSGRTDFKTKAINALKNSRYASAFRTMLAHSSTAREDFRKVASQIVGKEIKRAQIPMLSQDFSYDSLSTFEWTQALIDAEAEAPLTMSFLKGCIMPAHLQKAFDDNLENEDATAKVPVVGTILATLLYGRRPKTYKFLQKCQSLRLWMAGCTNDAISDLQKFGMCQGPKGTLSTVDKIREAHDRTAKIMKVQVENHLKKQADQAQAQAPDVPDIAPVRRRLRVGQEEQEIKKDIPKGYRLDWDNTQLETQVRKQGLTGGVNQVHLWANAYAAENTVGTLHLSDENPDVQARSMPVEVILPAKRDYYSLRQRMEVLVGRILVANFPYFEEFYGDCVVDHIAHEHSKESARKTPIVNLGVVEENPSTTTGAIAICEHLQKMVPKKPDGKPFPLVCHVDGGAHERMLGAMEASAGRANSWARLQALKPNPQEFHKRALLLGNHMKKHLSQRSIASRGSLYHIKERFEHRQVQVDVMKDFNRAADFNLFVTEGMICLLAMEVLGMDSLDDEIPGSPDLADQAERSKWMTDLCRELVSRVWGATPMSDINAVSSEEAEYPKQYTKAMLRIPYQYCLCKQDKPDETDTMVGCSNSGCKRGYFFHLNCIGLTPDTVPDDQTDWYCSAGCASTGISVLCNCSRSLPEMGVIRCARGEECCGPSFFHLGCVGLERVPDRMWTCQECLMSTEDRRADSVLQYSSSVVFHGLRDLCRRDAVRENDGPAMISMWKMEMIDFLENNHNKYLILAQRLLANVSGCESERIKEDLVWNRTVNVRGGQGKCIAMDLCCEFLNKSFKDTLKHSHGRYTKMAVSRASQVSSTFKDDLRNLTRQRVAVKKLQRRNRKKKSYKTDIRIFVEEYHKDKLFATIPGRCHRGFKDFINEQRLNKPGKMNGRLLAYAVNMDWMRNAQVEGEYADSDSDARDSNDDDNADEDDSDVNEEAIAQQLLDDFGDDFRSLVDSDEANVSESEVDSEESQHDNTDAETSDTASEESDS